MKTNNTVTLFVVPVTTIAVAIGLLGAFATGRFVRIIDLYEGAELAVSSVQLIEEKHKRWLDTISKTAVEKRPTNHVGTGEMSEPIAEKEYVAYDVAAKEALARIKGNSSLSLPMAEDYGRYLFPPCISEFVPHPRGRPYDLLISVPVELGELSPEEYRQVASAKTAQCEAAFEEICKEGTPILPSLLGADDLRLVFSRELALTLHGLLLDEEHRSRVNDWPITADLPKLTNTALGGAGGLMHLPTLEVARTVEESAKLLGHSVVRAIPLFEKGAFPATDSAHLLPVWWECEVWEAWSVLRDRNGEPLPAYPGGPPYRGQATSPLVAHIWSWYAIPDGYPSRRVAEIVAHNPLVHLVPAVAYSYGLGVRMDDPRLEEWLPPDFVALEKARARTIPLPLALMWSVEVLNGNTYIDPRNREALRTLVSLPGTRLLGLASD